MPNSCSNRSQPPNAPGTHAASTSGARDQVVAELAIALDRRSRRCDSLSAQRQRLAALDRIQERWNFAAGTIQVRLDDLEREPGSYSSVEGVAAAFQHGHACGGRKPVRGRDHPERSPQLRSRRELPHRPGTLVSARCATGSVLRTSAPSPIRACRWSSASQPKRMVGTACSSGTTSPSSGDHRRPIPGPFWPRSPRRRRACGSARRSRPSRAVGPRSSRTRSRRSTT